MIQKHYTIGILICTVLNLANLIYLIQKGSNVDGDIMFQVMVSLLSMGTMFMLLIESEQNKKLREEEVRMYELYNKSFENIIRSIRMKQHEFDNHITIIKNMNYFYNDHEELERMQTLYCDKLLSDNKLNKLLKVKLHPIIVQAIYIKLMSAQEKNIMKAIVLRMEIME